MSDPIISFPMFGNDFSLNPPRSISVFGFDIYWYGIIIAFGFGLAVIYAVLRAKDFDLTEDNILDMLIVTVPVSILGARIYYVAFSFDEYKSETLWGFFKNFINIRNGGIAIYGAVIAATLSVLIFCHVKKLPPGDMMDVGSLGLLIGQLVGRWGNFINREAFGCETNVLWKMGLTFQNGDTIYVHPTFFYESLWNFIGFIILHTYSKKHRRFKGQIFAIYAVWYGLGRFWIEWLRINTDSLLIINTPGFKLPISVCVAFLSVLLGTLYLLVKSKKTVR